VAVHQLGLPISSDWPVLLALVPGHAVAGWVVLFRLLPDPVTRPGPWGQTTGRHRLHNGFWIWYAPGRLFSLIAGCLLLRAVSPLPPAFSVERGAFGLLSLFFLFLAVSYVWIAAFGGTWRLGELPRAGRNR
jgi:hypothetical protein